MSRRVGIVGTFDVANYGDLLFPYLAEQELRSRLGDLRLTRYSYHQRSSDDWCFPVRSLTDLPADLDELDGLLVGGGHLLRFDRDIAPGYQPPTPALHHPTSYWLWPMTLAAEHGVPVAWNAPGASLDTPVWARSLLRLAVEVSQYVSVRDEMSRDEVLGVVGDAQLEVVPDTAFGLEGFLAASGDDAARAATDLLRRAGVSSPYLVVQPSPQLTPMAAVLDAALEVVAAAGVQVVQLPISPALGDRVGRLDLSVPTVGLDEWPDPPVLSSIIRAARGVVAHSFHLSVAALTAGVPVWRRAAPVGTKYSLIEGFEGVHRFGSDTAELGRHILDTPPAEVAADVLACSADVERHWDRVAQLFEGTAGRAGPAWPGDVGRWLPHELERVRTEIEGLRARHEHEVQRLETRAAESDRRRIDVERRNQDLEARLRASQSETHRARGEAGRWRNDYHRLRDRKAVRAGLKLAELSKPLFRAVRSGGTSTQEAADAHVPASLEEAEALAARLRASSPGSDRVRGPLVSVCVLNRDGEHHLRRLLAGLARATYRSFELVVVDNASSDDSVELLRRADVGVPVMVIENSENATFSDGNNQAVAAAEGEYVLLLNNDIEPVADGWLGHLVDTLEQEQAVAVGARLVYPRRPGLGGNQGDQIHADLSLQHRGVHLTTGSDGVPVGRNMGAGDDPMSIEATEVAERPALTAACLLLRRDAYDAVGGFTSGYRYGTEDVDLCLKLRAQGGRLVYDGQAVLWHHEYATQNERGREVKRRNRIHNREQFVDLWGPQVYRQVLLDKLRCEGEWSADPLQVAITVTRDDPSAGFGDYYTAHELGDALVGLGYAVTYLERHGDRWYDIDPGIDVLVVLLDSFELRRVPRSVLTVAWVRNWTERWVERPWFQDYDLVLASSAVSKELIEERTSKAAHLFPLATNPERFSPAGPAAERCLGVFTGNYWAKPRDIIPALQSLPRGFDVRVHGANWGEIEGVARLAHGSVDYLDLPSVYRGAQAVIDDTAEHAAPYHAVNSRVFDALATSTPVVTDNPEGLVELLGEEVREELLVWQDAGSLQLQLAWIRDHPEEARALAERWREVVVRDHTYARRAEQLRQLLVRYAEAVRVGIAIGVPRDEERHEWGDEHFARDVQRQLERRGHPSRVLILPEWEQAHAGRQDVVLHLFGLSELRTRPSQTNVLWNISHPELVTPALVDSYDIAFSAGRRFAEELAEKCLTPVHHLPQATDPSRFRPEPGTAPRHRLLFVGNSRKVRRRIVDDTVAVLGSLPGDPDLAIYGADWTADLVDPMFVAGDHIDNARLGSYYAAADVVLNDHWDDMRRFGFLSNRLYDALAAGAFVVSDHVEGIDEQFSGTVVTYTDRDSLASVLTHYLAAADERRALADHGRGIVLERHTFGHRVGRLLEVVAQHRQASSSAVVVAPA